VSTKLKCFKKIFYIDLVIFRKANLGGSLYAVFLLQILERGLSQYQDIQGGNGSIHAEMKGGIDNQKGILILQT
jgi:hypothetical protein